MSNQEHRRAALVYHAKPKPGKTKVVPTKNYNTQRDLALAYSPGVAVPCTEIEKQKSDVYKYTNKGNLVAVITNGTAVLGLGDIGPSSNWNSLPDFAKLIATFLMSLFIFWKLFRVIFLSCHLRKSEIPQDIWRV